MSQKVLIIGGGAAGYFAALNLPQSCKVKIIEAGRKPLQKVRVSGGGRCNVTHSCFESARLVGFYPRGSKELRGPFSRFQPRDMMEWLQKNGVDLKIEDDGRVFPISDNSETIIDCFTKLQIGAGIELLLETKIVSLRKEVTAEDQGEFLVVFRNSQGTYKESFDCVLIATGSSKSGYKLAKNLGHEIVEPIPSLFSFECSDPELKKLAGVSVQNAELSLKLSSGAKFSEKGALLITHWGLSGPVVIKLSAWAARELHQTSYKATLTINWVSSVSRGEFAKSLSEAKLRFPNKSISKNPILSIPKRLWEKLCDDASISRTLTFQELGKKIINTLEQIVFCSNYSIEGKGVFKEEFVTCGGVELSEVDLKTMESKIEPGLYFAGEVLNIDGLTGGFNFQSAWTTAFIASEHIASCNTN